MIRVHAFLFLVLLASPAEACAQLASRRAVAKVPGMGAAATSDRA